MGNLKRFWIVTSICAVCLSPNLDERRTDDYETIFPSAQEANRDISLVYPSMGFHFTNHPEMVRYKFEIQGR